MTLMSNESASTGNQVTGQSTAGNSGGSTTDGSTSGSNSGGSTSGSPTSWRDTLPDDLKANGTLAAFKDVPALAKSYIHAQSMVGKKGVIVPGEKASDEEWTSFYRAIGQPEADKYEIKAPEGSKLPEDVMGKIKETSIKLGLLPKQAQGFMDMLENHGKEAQAAQLRAHQTEAAQQVEGLKKEWGLGYEKNIGIARQAVKDVGEEFVQYLDKTGLGNDVTLIRAFAKLGSYMGEDKLRGDGGGKFGKTPSEINKEIQDVMGNPKSPYFDKTHPMHKTVLAEMEQRFKALNPS